MDIENINLAMLKKCINDKNIFYCNDKIWVLFSLKYTSCFATTHVVVSVIHPIT